MKEIKHLKLLLPLLMKGCKYEGFTDRYYKIKYHDNDAVILLTPYMLRRKGIEKDMAIWISIRRR